MSDQRRESVARAMWLFDHSYDAAINDAQPTDLELSGYRALADAALVAIDAAEPTDAEVDTAQQVYWETLQSVQEDYTNDQEKSRYAMRIALYAARKART